SALRPTARRSRERSRRRSGGWSLQLREASPPRHSVRRKGAEEDRMVRSEKDKMVAGELYDPTAADIQVEHRAAMAWLARYNAMLAATAAERLALLRERFAAVGDGCDIRPPFHCDYGFNISLGSGVFLNFGCC